MGEQGTPPSLDRYLYAYANPTVYIDLMGYKNVEGTNLDEFRGGVEKYSPKWWIGYATKKLNEAKEEKDKFLEKLEKTLAKITTEDKSGNKVVDPKVLDSTVKGFKERYKLSDEFIQKVVKIAQHLKTKPEYLLAIMAFETGYSFSPSEINKAGSGAVGLIQFMPKTAKGLGTTADDLAKMTSVEQLDYVEKYFNPYSGKLKTVQDTYMVVLWPSAVGQKEDYVLFNTGTIAYEQNKGLDYDGDGKITKLEASKKVSDILAGKNTVGARKIPKEKMTKMKSEVNGPIINTLIAEEPFAISYGESSPKPGKNVYECFDEY